MMANLSIIRCTGLRRNKTLVHQYLKNTFFNSKFSVEPNRFVPGFYKKHEVAWKYQKKECWENVDIRLSRSKGEDG